MQSFPFFGVFWLFWYLIQRGQQPSLELFTKDESDINNLNSRVQYIANGLTIATTHFFYYFEKLKLYNSDCITEETIQQAYKECILNGKNRYNKEIVQEYRAAKAFLIDRYLYAGHMN
jgi:hypothetical protein